MKKHYLLLLAVAILMVGCSKDKGEKEYQFEEISKLEDLSKKETGVTPSDTMMYYFGAMQAANYLQDAETDTLLKTDKQKEAFMKGFRDAAVMVDESDAYNKGLQLGLRLGMRLKEFEERYGMDYSADVLAASLQHFINNPDEVELVAAQKSFYEVKDRLETKAAQKDVAGAMDNLAKVAKERGFTRLSDTLYVKDVTPKGSGPVLKPGDKVAVDVIASTLDGEEITTRQFPDSLVIGEGRVPKVVFVGMETMTSGQTRQFMTTPRTLMGKRLRIYNLDPEEPVIFTVKAIQN